MNSRIKGIRYKSVNECLASYFHCKPRALDQITGNWVWKDANGVERSMSNQDALKTIRKRGYWAWVENKAVIHFFISRRVHLRNVIKLFAHELGHMQRPFHRSLQEEQKASVYAELAVKAYDLATQAYKGR